LDQYGSFWLIPCFSTTSIGTSSSRQLMIAWIPSEDVFLR